MSSLPKRYSICDLILDNNSITKIEKLDAYPKLTSVSSSTPNCFPLISRYLNLFLLEM